MCHTKPQLITGLDFSKYVLTYFWLIENQPGHVNQVGHMKGQGITALDTYIFVPTYIGLGIIHFVIFLFELGLDFVINSALKFINLLIMWYMNYNTLFIKAILRPRYFKVFLPNTFKMLRNVFLIMFLSEIHCIYPFNIKRTRLPKV